MLTVSNKIFLKTATHQYNQPQYTQAPKQPKLKTLNKDIISFGYIDAPPPSKDLQLYRCIGVRELRALLKGETIEGHSYATSDPRGWAASNWHSGFGHNGRNLYFVTFKTGDKDFDTSDRRDSFVDTRYSVGDYNLSNVTNIRKGHSAHGELVYAEDFENAKKLDKQTKLQEIKRLLKDLKNLQNPTGVNKFLSKIAPKNTNTADEKEIRLVDIYDELGSYANEFPEIIEDLKPLSIKDDRSANLLIKVISDADRHEDLTFVRETLQKFLKNKFPIDETPVNFIKRHGSKEDVRLILDILKAGQNSEYSDIGLTLKKISTPQTHNLIKETYLSGNLDEQYALMDYFEEKPDNAEIARFTLDKYKDRQKNILDTSNYRHPALISMCIKFLEQSGSKADIHLLEEYTKERFSYANDEAADAIKKLKRK